MNKYSKNKSFNNNGFTLIELIVVIVILGIIATLISFAVTDYIKKGKNTTYENYKKNLIGAAENMIIDCLINNETDCKIDIPSDNSTEVIKYDVLVDNGYSDGLKDPEGSGYCDTSYVVVKNTGKDNLNLEYHACLFCNNYSTASTECDMVLGDDDVAPVCDYSKLSGASTSWTNLPRTITVGCDDVGFGCSQTLKSKTFGTEGSVIKNGNIVISDRTGNLTTCPVDVYVDMEKPTCELAIDGDLNSDWYTSGAKVVFKNRNDNGSGVVTWGLGNSLASVNYNKLEQYTSDANKVQTIYGYVKDGAGNEGYCAILVQVDSIAPTATIKMGYQANYTEKLTSSINSNVTKKYSTTIDNISTYAKLYINRISGLVVYLNEPLTSNLELEVISGTNVTTKTILASSTNKKSYFEIPITLLNSTDQVLIGSDIDLDIEKIEVLKDESETSVWTNQDVTVHIDATDIGTGVDSYSFDNNYNYDTLNFKTFASNTNGYVKVKDKAGNVSENIIYTINKIDKIKPYTDKEKLTNEIANKMFENAVLTQWDGKNGTGNDISEYTAVDYSTAMCNADNEYCSLTVCLANVSGSFRISGFKYNSFNLFKDDESGFYRVTEDSRTLFNKNYVLGSADNEETANGCLHTKGDNPCTYEYVYKYYDNAGNYDNTFKILFKVGYILEKDDGSGCSKYYSEKRYPYS